MGMADLYGQRMEGMSHPWTNVSGPVIRMGGKEVLLQDLVNERNEVVAHLRAKLDRAERALKRALKRAGFQDLGGQEWKPPLGKIPASIDEENDGGGCQFAGPGRGDCEHFVGLHGQGENVYGKPYGWCWYCWQSKQLEDLRRGKFTSGPTDAKVDALARVLHEALRPEISFNLLSPHGKQNRINQSRAAFAHIGAPEVSTKPVDLWAVITSIVDVRVDCDGCDYVEMDRTSVSDLEVALRPWLRDPVGWELDVHPDQLELYKWVTEPDGGYAYAAQQAIDLCRSSIRPVYECDCSAIEKERDLLKVEYESRQIMINNVRAALEGRPFKNTLEGE